MNEPLDKNIPKTGMSEEKSRKLKHVKVYDQLYAQIINGEYPKGSQLPSEPDLSKEMGVSRMTLRQALALLREDGLIHNVQGKGNFVQGIKKSPAKNSPNLCNPVFQCGQTVTETETEYRLEPPTDFISDMIGRKTPVVAITDRWYKDQAGSTFAYSLSFIPIETVTQFNIDFTDMDSLTRFLNQDIYRHAVSSTLNLRGSDTGNFTAQKYRLSEKNTFLMIQENLYSDSGLTLAATKHYIPLESCNLVLTFQK